MSNSDTIKSRISALAALLGRALPWKPVTPSDIASALFLLDWKLVAFGHPTAISDTWVRGTLGLPIAPDGVEGVALASVLDSIGSTGGSNAVQDALDPTTMDFANLIAEEFATYRSRQDLLVRFLAATPVYSSPERAPMSLTHYASHLPGGPLQQSDSWRKRKLMITRLEQKARSFIGPKRPPESY